jgi:hypothetical protein
MIFDAPASRAPWTAFRPTPPHPMTSTDDPASTLAALVTAPTPVGTEQPLRAAWGNGMSLRIGISISDGQTTYSEKVPMRAIWKISCPLWRSRWVPSSMPQRALLCPSHRIERPLEQYRQWPHWARNEKMM